VKGLKWWLWIVGAFYLIEGGGTALLRLADPESAAAIWTATGQPGVLDPIAVQAVLVPGLFASLSWLVLGVLMVYFARAPERAGVLVIVVVALELFAWMPLDIVGLANGWPAARAVMLMVIHLAIAVGGILALRATRTVQPAAARATS
jgi:hypothetical protein